MNPPADPAPEIVEALIAGDSRPLVAALAAMGMTAPEIRWEPTAETLAEPRLGAMLDYWNALRARGSLPRLGDVDPLGLGEAIGYAMLLEAQPDGDYRYILYGSRIAERAGFDMTGKRTREVMPASPAIPFLFAAIYRAAAARRAPVFSVHSPPSSVHVTEWRRLVLPLTGASGRIDFLVGNVPGATRP